MEARAPIAVFGPAYLDIVIHIDMPIIAGSTYRLDQSLPASRMDPRTDGLLVFQSPLGDQLTFRLPAAAIANAATITLGEVILARLAGNTAMPVAACHQVRSVTRELGGMGAGFAKACQGVLRMPLGEDTVGAQVEELLQRYGINACPARLPGTASDTTFLVLSRCGEKLAVGLRDALIHWQPAAEDFAWAQRARAVIFCGAPNAFAQALLTRGITCPVLYAPAMRTLSDTEIPLESLAPDIDYLALNALEWANVANRERVLREVAVVSVTDGQHGSRIYSAGQVVEIPAVAADVVADTNRAGETYASTLFKLLLRERQNFAQVGIDVAFARYAGQIASRQAARQLALTQFAFPPDDWENVPE